MADRIPGILNVPGLSAWRLTFALYAAGYVLYLVPALVWAWQQGVQPFLGFALWQALLYAPLWPLMLISRVTAMVIATV